MPLQIVILAAGQGKRMHSKMPKVLHELAGRPLLEHVICTALKISPAVPPIIVYGHQGKVLHDRLAHYNVHWIEQKEQLGTGHALLQALPKITTDDRVLVLYGDVPLISEQTLRQLIDTTPAEALGMLTAHLSDPTHYGRIKRDLEQNIIRVIEEKDATLEDRSINEINPGIYLLPGAYLKKWLPALSNKNSQGEYYLTDIIACAVQEKLKIHGLEPMLCEEILGVNDRVQLAALERFYQRSLAEKLMREGVTIYDPARFDVRGELKVGKEVVIDVNAIFEGRVVIGDHCVVGPNTYIRNTEIGDGVEIKANSYIDGAEIAADCIVGPFARLRPGTVLDKSAHIGNFVEVKNSEIGEGSKINHLSYIGDSEIGKRVNIGAGTITCNYDGVNKHKTIIGDDTQIGSDTQLVAPVTVGQGATIGAGSTIIKDVPSNQLTITHHIDQRSIKNWQRPDKIKKEEITNS